MFAKKKQLWIASGLALAYAVNVAFNEFYKTATEEQLNLLRQRSQSIRTLDKEGAGLDEIEALMARANFSSFTTFAPNAVQRRNAVTHYLRNHVHATLGIAIDELGPDEPSVLSMLRQVNSLLSEFDISIGLAGAFKAVDIPPSATRSEIYHGTTTAFGSGIDHHFVFTHKECSYPQLSSRPPRRPTNRVYSFGRRGLTVIDAVAVDRTFAKTVALAVIDQLSKDTKARRWRAADYALAMNVAAGADRKRRGRTHVGPSRRIADKGQRTVSVTIGLDKVDRASALRHIERVNQVFADHAIRFDVRHTYDQRLTNGWRWPRVITAMQAQNKSDIYLLLTARDWRPATGDSVRGLSSYLFGAALVQTGTIDQTTKRLAHELGHLFGLAHTFVAGHIMYPTESRIGLSWSPGSIRALKENRHNTPWRFLQDYPTRMQVASRLAPPMVAGRTYGSLRKGGVPARGK